MLKKLYRKLAGKRSAIDVFLDRPWAIQVAPLAGGTMADFDGDTNTITVNAYPGKHPAEKPLDLMRHIVRVSSRPGDLVLDSFTGSGTTGQAAAMEGRRFVGFEKDARWHARAQKRIAAAYGDWKTAQQPRTIADNATHEDLPLFAEA